MDFIEKQKRRKHEALNKQPQWAKSSFLQFKFVVCNQVSISIVYGNKWTVNGPTGNQ